MRIIQVLNKVLILVAKGLSPLMAAYTINMLYPQLCSISVNISGRTVRVAANIVFSGLVALRALLVTSTHKELPPDPQVRFLDLADLKGINNGVDS